MNCKNCKETSPKLLTAAPRAAARCLASPQLCSSCRKLLAVLRVTVQLTDPGLFCSIDYMKNPYCTLEITASSLFLSFPESGEYLYVFM